MTKAFLTVYDYGTGGVWLYIRAESEREIHEKFRGLTVYTVPPPWMTERLRAEIERETYDLATLERERPAFARLLRRSEKDRGEDA